jgi:hypothetical protein
MCTVTVLREREKTLVTMNRDEHRERAPEKPPTATRDSEGELERISPTDGERGGTWIGCNSSGLVVCLLNRYGGADLDVAPSEDTPSRGWIVDHLLTRHAEEVWCWLESEFDAGGYPPFSLVVLTRSEGRVLDWLGDGWQVKTIPLSWSMETSSLLKPDEVQAWRRREFDRWCAGGRVLSHGVPTFNLLSKTGNEQMSPLTSRELSATRSITQVEVLASRKRVTMRYWAREGDREVDPSAPTRVLSIPLEQSSADVC